MQLEARLYNQCREISRNHLTSVATRFLMKPAELPPSHGLLSIAFGIPHGTALGVKLIDTPWTDANMKSVHGITVEQLRQEQHEHGMPESLAEVLHMAAHAGVRVLIFDTDAPVLTGLPVYESE